METAKKKYDPVIEAPAVRPTDVSPAAPRSLPPAPRSPLPAPGSLPGEDVDSPAEVGFVLDEGNAGQTWRRAIEKIPGLTGDYARKFNRLELSGINRVTIFFSPEHAFCKTACQRPEQVLRFEQALKDASGETIRVEFKLLESPQAAGVEASAPPMVSPHQRLMEAAGHPLVRRASELFGAQPTAVE